MADIRERFWGYVKQGPGCWEWTGPLRPDGYGVLAVRSAVPRTQRAHRLSWEIQHGPVPPGLWVLHRCDNRGCVRPDHLFLGTHEDNMADAVAKGRMHPGEAHGMCKLTVAQVDDIRALMQRGAPVNDVARMFGVHRNTVSGIWHGRTRKAG